MIKAKEIYEVLITGFDYEGLGVARIDNFVVFVEFGVINDFIKIEITEVKKNFAFARILEIIKASDKRENSFCKNFFACGGCDLWHISYHEQLEFKRNLVKETFYKIAGLILSDVKIFGHEESFSYRNKVQIPFTEINGKIIYGFYKKNSHEIVSLEGCKIQDSISEIILKDFKEIMQKKAITAYNEARHKGLVRHVIFRKNYLDELMIILVINGRVSKNLIEALESLQKKYPKIISCFINCNIKKTNVIFGEELVHIFGKETLTDKIDNLFFEISPDSFFQINSYMTKILYQEALKLSNLNKRDIVVDCYSGIGTITLFLASKIKFAYGIEIVKNAVNNARNNAKLNNISNVLFMEGDVTKKLGEILLDEKIDALIFDPPRKGLGVDFLKTIIPFSIKKIIYVACDIKSAARDVKFLLENNYIVQEVKAFDMFPGTKHVEICISLIKKELEIPVFLKTDIHLEDYRSKLELKDFRDKEGN